MKKLSVFIMIFILLVVVGGCDRGTVQSSETDHSEKEGNTEDSQKTEIVESSGDDESEKDWITAMKEEDLSRWFKEYNGELVQRIKGDGSYEDVGVTQRREVIFYNTEENDIQEVAKMMLKTLIDPLMESTAERPYTIIRYELEEQPIKQICEDVWVIEIIKGYYEYEGTDFLPMENALQQETNPKDGMVRFFAQGSEEAFRYIIIKQDNVYRMQFADDMKAVISTI